MFVDGGNAGCHHLHMRTDNEPAGLEVSNVTPKPPGRGSERDCAVEATVAVIGGKWKPILLFHLLGKPQRYSELARLVPCASERMLTRSMRELEADGLVSRTVFAEVPTRVEYTLTADGRTLVPILQAMSDWGARRGVGRVCLGAYPEEQLS